MKILLIGDPTKGGLIDGYYSAFLALKREGGISDVLIFDDWGNYKNNFLAKNKYFHHLFWRFLAVPLQKKIVRAVELKKPNLIIIFKGWLIKPKTISAIRKILPRTKIFNLNPDNPFNTWHHGNSNDWIRKSIPYYDAYYTCKRFLVEKIKKMGAKKVIYLPVGYNPEIHYLVEVKDENEKEYYGSDIAFIGSWDEEREWWLNNLIIDNSITYSIKIWGNAWERANKKLREKWQGRAVMGEEFSKVCASSKIIINIIRKQDESSHNMKTFEIPACGGLNLSTRSQEALEFFPENIAGVYFSSVDELKEKINYLMDNEEERKRIINNAYQYLINGHHTYFDRVKTIVYNLNNDVK
jgi:glycosyltransferase involved in cell wall biosynthesis